MKTHIEVSSKNLIHNLTVFNEISGKKVMFVVKANAYGHGLKEVVQITRDLPFIEYYAVDSLNEALIVKVLAGDKKILVVGWVDDTELEELIRNRIEMVVPSVDYWKKVQSVSKKLKMDARVHLKLDTGTSRLGMDSLQILDLFNRPKDTKPEIAGMYSHFANIEDTTDHSYALKQLTLFNDLITKIKSENILKHFSCSASTLLFPETYFDLVRVGISAYGYWPSKRTYISYIEKNKKPIELKPVLSWLSKVAQIKHFEKGKPIGYGLTYQTFSKSKIIVVPVGYYDGYDRKLSNISNIIVNGVRAPIRGRICMDMLMAEVTHIQEVNVGDRVFLIGQNNDVQVDADYLGELTGTINYEILARINPLIPRIIVP
jgi:alanine racemase